MQARLCDPTWRGLHANLVLVRIGGEKWTALGSLNGGEVSHKGNREVVVLVDHPLIYDRPREDFLHDWVLAAP